VNGASPFSSDAKEILGRAHDIAVEWQHRYVTTEHILAAFCRHSTSISGQLASMGIDTAEIDRGLKFVTGVGCTPPWHERGISPRCKMMLEYAADEAKRRGKRKIGADEMFLGLLQTDGGLAKSELDRLGINPHRACNEQASRIRRSRPRN
jgi:ATP-dependent Clp protease ATP-binding subunit ClpA